MSDSLILDRPDDAHLHLRDGAALEVSVRASARSFGRAVVMPNLVPPVTTVDAALAYRARILAAVPEGVDFEPLMTLYLTDRTPAAEIRRAAESDGVVAVKAYPAGATTNSDSGVTDLANTFEALEAMQECGMPLLVHGEVTDLEVDVFDRERVFLERELAPLVERFEGLPVVFEHVTTAVAVAFVQGARAGVAATLTPQHLLLDRNDLLAGGLRPHHYCAPVLKRAGDREALRRAATSGDPRFFLGTDSAPHARAEKESACGCAGCFSAPAGLELYAHVFDELGALDRLEAFASHHAADFYGLPRPTEKVTLVRRPWTVPERLDYPGEGGIVPLWAGRELDWRQE